MFDLLARLFLPGELGQRLFTFSIVRLRHSSGAGLLEAVTIRLMEDSERKRFDEVATKHYLKNAQLSGECCGMLPNIGPVGRVVGVQFGGFSPRPIGGCTGPRAQVKLGGISLRRMPGFWFCCPGQWLTCLAGFEAGL